LVLKSPVEITALPNAPVIAVHESANLRDVMRDMLKYSTNLTAEAAGLAATKTLTNQTRGLRTSALGMTRWAKDRAGIGPEFADHSGLGDASRISAGDMVSFLTAENVKAQLFPIMKNIVMRDDNKKPIKNYPAIVQAKTGTLNFVSSLAGYIRTASGRELAFAIFAADLEARERGKITGGEQPVGSITFNTNAKRLQQVLLQRWAALNDVAN
jgi:D-alanyl-D-alanine carboxypeptidase/D-alanyl-D-alanine-endopeptidase (penicillin-binding protein 4)